jgi:hypothetical protein
MVEQSITLVAAANEGSARSAAVTVKSKDGKLAIEYTISQAAAKSLFIYGEASEYGADITGAREFRHISDNTYQLYTKLTVGTFNLTSSTNGDIYYYKGDDSSDTPNTYTLTQGNGYFAGTPLENTTEAVYRITVDLTAMTMTLEAITGVQLKHGGNDDWTRDFTYASDGVWESKTIGIERIGWWGERYNFAAFASEKEEIWGYHRSNNDGPEVYHYTAEDPTNNNLPPQYLYVRDRGEISSWDYTFKDGREGSMEHNLEEVYLT